MNKIEKLIKRPFAYKIDKNDERIFNNSLIFGTLGTILLTFIIILFLKYDKSIEFKEQALQSFKISLLISIPLIIILGVLFYKQLMKIRNIQKLAELIFSSKYYINPQVTQGAARRNGNLWLNIFNQGLIGSREKFKSLYFPKFYISQRNNQIKIYIYLDGSNFQEQFINLDKKLELVYGLTLTDKYIDNEHQVYVLKLFNEKDRIKFTNIENETNKIKLMNNLYWNFRKEPHAIITGSTGSGKTYLLFYILKEILRKGYDLRIIDPKRSDLSQFEKVSNNLVAYNKEDIIQTIRDTVIEMEERYEYMLNQYGNFGEDFEAYGMKPYFLIFDEQSAFMTTLDTKEKKEVDNLLRNIILKGRQAGVNIIFTLQRPDTQFLDGVIRDQLHLRIGLGKLSTDGYRMLFDKIERNFNELDTVGYGYYKIYGKGEIPKIFLSPYVDNTQGVYQEIVRLIKEREL
ncbi:DUF2075 domain-containing protein [Gemella sp. GH3]|uniref:FtsK/SpoIIIE domain-containing protein n=1 Tax=unclassified Gemella TaxID=2624949 RepID=UPI0015D04BCF|nr:MULTISPECIES: FtsK/SpoIIIE domain-containing protein [unclassified Gemella]MBF0714562.1 DUF2075 domain-containing protein [Gemella sp. GH3.1]NYS51514.1 DUF2075 domain-containing protein [Gemella sp. GH3]